MTTDQTMSAPLGLSDDELTAEIQRLARSERASTAALVAHLAEFDTRRLHLEAGFRSLFAYCTEVLHLSEHEAYNRIEAAHLARRFPRLVPMLEDGALNLTTIRLLAPHMNDDNHEQLLAEASGKSKREVERVLVQYFPKPAVPSSIRKVPVTVSPAIGAERSERGASALPTPERSGIVEGRTTVDANTERVVAEDASAPNDRRPSPGAAEGVTGVWQVPGRPASAASTRRREVVRPLAPEMFEVRFTATADTCAKLKLAQQLLRHALPDGDMAAVVDRAVTVLLEDLARKKFAATRRPRNDETGGHPSAGSGDGQDRQGSGQGQEGDDAAPTEPRGSRHIPAMVKRAVWLRDKARCAFVGKAGRRCTARGFLEFHHVRPYGVGGEATRENIQLRCRAHNAYEADLFYRYAEPVDVMPAQVGGGELVPERVGPAGGADTTLG